MRGSGSRSRTRSWNFARAPRPSSVSARFPSPTPRRRSMSCASPTATPSARKAPRRWSPSSRSCSISCAFTRFVTETAGSRGCSRSSRYTTTATRLVVIYETLYRSSQGGHEGQHDLIPWLNYFLGVVRRAYREFEESAGQIKTPRGAKTALVEAAIGAFPGDFTLAELERACPGVSRDMVRRVLRELQKAGKVACLGRGPGAAWRRKG